MGMSTTHCTFPVPAGTDIFRRLPISIYMLMQPRATESQFEILCAKRGMKLSQTNKQRILPLVRLLRLIIKDALDKVREIRFS